MNFEIIVFCIALIAIIVMVQLKRVEIRTGRQSFLSSYGSKTNDTLRYWYRGGRNFFSKRTMVLISVWSRAHLARSVSKTEKVVVRSYSAIKKHPKVVKILRGHSEVEVGGKASSFLKNISGDDIVK